MELEARPHLPVFHVQKTETASPNPQWIAQSAEKSR